MEWNISSKVLEINGNSFSDLKGFYQEFSNVFMKDQDWEVGSLDGVNDVLYGGFGVFENDETIEVIWKNSEKSKKDLGKQATLDWLDQKLQAGKMFNTALISNKKEEVLKGKGETLFGILLDILSEHKKIKIVLE